MSLLARLRFLPGLWLVSVALGGLSGCVSDKAAKDAAGLVQPAEDQKQDATAQAAASPEDKDKAGTYRDPLVATNSANPDRGADKGAAPPSGQAMAMNGTGPADRSAPPVMEATGINAHASSIFAAQPGLTQPGMTQPQSTPSAAPVGRMPFGGSRGGVYSSPSVSPAPAPSPVPQLEATPPRAASQRKVRQHGVPLDDLDQTSSAAPPSAAGQQQIAALDGGRTINALYSAPKQGLLTDLTSLLQKASMPGLTRTAPNGLHVQGGSVQVACFKPKLISLIQRAEQHFGKPAVITSGYRDPEHNRSVGGAEESLHKTCDAADVKIAGVSKWEIASFIRAQPDRGGVGTYCHTDSVHVDTGNSRDWNWGCEQVAEARRESSG